MKIQMKNVACRMKNRRDGSGRSSFFIPHSSFPERGSALIIVLWVCLGIVSIALYFAHSMSFEIRAADNRVSGLQAEQAIAGAARYASNILFNLQTPGLIPDEKSYERDGVAIGDARFWFIGRSDQQTGLDEPWFGLVDEGSKLNLNTATAAMLEALPHMTPQLAAAIIDWRDTDSTEGRDE